MRGKRRLLASLLCVGAACAAGCGSGGSTSHPSSATTSAQTSSLTGSLPPFSAGVQARIRTAAQQFMATNKYPGLVVGIWGPRAAFVQAFGDGNLRTHAPISTSDYLRIGSITKTFTGTVILQLAQQGKLSLNDKLSQFEPQIPNASNITIRELLNMTSGLVSNAPSVARQYLSDPQKPISPQQAIAAAAAHPLLSTPGKTYNYSDAGYLILGEVATKVTGTDIGTLIQRQVLAPVGLQHTVYAPSATIPSPSALGYVIRHDQSTDTSTWSYAYSGSAGAMASTLGDLKTYAQAVASGNGLLNAATQAQRVSSMVPTNVPGVSYGLGIFRIGSFLGHNGEVAGYDAVMLASPSQQMTLVILGNTSPILNQPPQPNGETLNLAPQLIQIAAGQT
jgi:D-alanyl-D-alanine carboxypeptidase